MDSTQVQRTLVKSPPELWAELSDPASLARHLGELGEIRITRIEPEHKVEWAAESASGTVLIKPAGWGTRVTLTASREPDAPESAPVGDPCSDTQDSPPPAPPQLAPPQADHGLPASRVEPPAHGPMPPAAEPLRPITDQAPPIASTEPPIGAERDPAADDAIAPTLEPPEPARTPPARAPEPTPREPEPAGDSRRRFFTRLLARMRRDEPAGPPPHTSRPLEQGAVAPSGPGSTVRRAGLETDEPPAPLASEQPAQLDAEAPLALAVQAKAPVLDAHEPVIAQPINPLAGEPPMPVADQAHAAAAGKAAAAATADGEVAAVLTAVLDRLGAAHHRPFSRA